MYAIFSVIFITHLALIFKYYALFSAFFLLFFAMADSFGMTDFSSSQIDSLERVILL